VDWLAHFIPIPIPIPCLLLAGQSNTVALLQLFGL
jgi:hypothetical protein